MKAELDVAEVAARLSELRALCVPEGVPEARERLARERPTEAEAFEVKAARALEELRALCELANALHAGARPPR